MVSYRMIVYIWGKLSRKHFTLSSFSIHFWWSLIVIFLGKFWFLFFMPCQIHSLQWVSNGPLWTFAECLVTYSKWDFLWVLNVLHPYLDSLHTSEFHSPWKVSLKNNEKVRRNHCFLLEEFAFLSVISVHYLIAYLNFVLFLLQEFTQ